MKRLIKLTCWVVVIIVALAIFIKVIDYNSLVSKNTRYLEQILSEGIKGTNGNVKDLITLQFSR